VKASAAESSASAHLHHLATTVCWDLLLLSLREGKIVELLSMALRQLLGFLDLLLNLRDLLRDLASFQLSLRGLRALGKEGDVLLEPGAGVLGSAPDFILPAILDHHEISDQLETGTVRLNMRSARLVVTFNLEVLIRIKVHEAIYIVCPVGISWLDPVRPLCDHDSLGLRSVDHLNNIWINDAAIGIMGSSTEFLNDDVVSLVEVRLSHHRLQYVTLVLVDDCL
jgi:hypothetical protein